MYQIEKILGCTIGAVIELKNELYESSKACWEDDAKRLSKRINELDLLETKIASALADIRAKRECAANQHGRSIKVYSNP